MAIKIVRRLKLAFFCCLTKLKNKLSHRKCFIGMKEDDAMFKKRIEKGKSSVFIFFGVEAYDIEICNKNVI